MSLVLSNVAAIGPWGTRLEGIDLRLSSGAITVITGRGGCGKTLLMNVLGGTATIHRGEIACDSESDPRIVYQSVHPLLPPGESVEAFLRSLDVEVPTHFGLNELTGLTVDCLPARYRRALWLIAAIGRPADVYLFDEPTLGFDREYIKNFSNLLKPLVDNGAAIAIATNDLQLAADTADYGVVLGDGKILIQGRVEELRENINGSGLFSELWKIHCTD